MEEGDLVAGKNMLYKMRDVETHKTMLRVIAQLIM
jgi:hypothetical protein